MLAMKNALYHQNAQYMIKVCLTVLLQGDAMPSPDQQNRAKKDNLIVSHHSLMDHRCMGQIKRIQNR